MKEMKEQNLCDKKREERHHKRFIMAVAGSILCTILWIVSWKVMNGSWDVLIWIASIVTMMMLAIDINLNTRKNKE